jgi:PilZ domain
MSNDILSLRQRLASATGNLSSRSSGARSEQPADPPGLFGRLIRKPAGWVRRHQRFPCCIVAVLDVLDKNVPIDGLVTEISEGGLLFRPASAFVFDRRGALVTIRFGQDEIDGLIVNVKSTGYGVRFGEEIDLDRIEGLLQEFGLPNDVAA